MDGVGGVVGDDRYGVESGSGWTDWVYGLVA